MNRAGQTWRMVVIIALGIALFVAFVAAITAVIYGYIQLLEAFPDRKGSIIVLTILVTLFVALATSMSGNRRS